MPITKKVKRHRKKRKIRQKNRRSEILLTLLISLPIILLILLLVWILLPTPSPYASTLQSAADWMLRRQEPSGHFAYEYDPWKDQESQDDNLVRQAGAGYIMAELFEHDKKGTYLESVTKSLQYLNTHTKTETRNNTPHAYITEKTQGSTGTLALALISCESLRGTLAWNQNPTLAQNCENYLNTLNFLENPSGGFSAKYYPDEPKESPLFDKQSPYYNGEAFLALIHIYERTQDPALFSRLQIHFNHFDQYYRNLIAKERNGKDTGKEIIGFYLWGMRALNRLDTLHPDPRYRDLAYLYTNFVIEDRNFDNPEKFAKKSYNQCYALEGIISTYAMASRASDTKVTERLRPIIENMLTHLKTYQIQPDTTKKQINNGRLNRLSLPNPQKAIGGFYNSTQQDNLRLRIDNTQHCIGAFLLAEKYLQK